jgi:hypothetical protein
MHTCRLLPRASEGFVRVLLDELIKRNASIIGHAKGVICRCEFQGAGAKGNRPHEHAGITMESEPSSVSVARLCCSSTEFATQLYGADYDPVVGLGIVSGRAEYDERAYRLVKTPQTHWCDNAHGRCMIKLDSQGNRICRYRKQPPLPFGQSGGWFEDAGPTYTPEVFGLLGKLGLAEKVRRQLSEEDAKYLREHGHDGLVCEWERSRWQVHEVFGIGKWHYHALQDEFFLARVSCFRPYVVRLPTSLCATGIFQVGYLVEYIAGKEEY